MKTSENGLAIIKSCEGCHLKAYLCPAGKPTIGYGHTKGVKLGQTITQAQADAYLREDVSGAEKNVNGFMSKYNFNQNQFDALVSFAYNIGSINQLTANGTRSIAQIADKITAYNKGGGKVLNGLVKRRAKEQALFNTPVASVQAAQVSKYPCHAVCTGDGVRVRTAPSKSASVLKAWPKLNKGNEVMEIGEENGFNKVLIADKHVGYVWGEYLAD